MNRKRVKLFLSMSASVAILLLWGFFEPERPIQPAQPEHIREADAYVTGVLIQQFDDDGLLTHAIRGERMRHLTRNGSTLIDEPVLTLFREGRAPINAEARFGEFESEHDIFWLRQQVVIYNQVDRRYRIEAPYLKINAEQERAETDADVVLHQPIGATYATGMTANFATNRFQLHHAVRGTYEPN